jgi:NAD(P)-dependent dehydrogenase (short-subunit alcohol dehydrogenase family)
MNNSTALVTGADKGIGREIARQRADDGPTGEFHCWDGTAVPW